MIISQPSPHYLYEIVFSILGLDEKKISTLYVGLFLVQYSTSYTLSVPLEIGGLRFMKIEFFFDYLKIQYS